MCTDQTNNVDFGSTFESAFDWKSDFVNEFMGDNIIMKSKRATGQTFMTLKYYFSFKPLLYMRNMIYKLQHVYQQNIYYVYTYK